ncbi:MAG: bifunctional hydroxymethylpyrimidine kinase/phosphomethylpyrimidine kinase, partial [Verrucomicrobia bacterium]|nr:bifunctional hydroxymethylpyrimidine kinase/phosphomethylpyrimidine kinase [Verrucomicrobiota bacterium]
ETHGTGCTYSAAICAGLAKGLSLETAVSKAKKFITRAIRWHLKIGRYTPLNHLQA